MSTEQQTAYTRQAVILRKNLIEWEQMLRNPRGEDWPTMLGRLNAALNQASNMDKKIDDVLEHFVYVPKKSTANPQDIPFFLSTRLETPASDSHGKEDKDEPTSFVGDPVLQLSTYENNAARLAAEYEDNMVRF
jgi:hypothetical protein